MIHWFKDRKLNVMWSTNPYHCMAKQHSSVSCAYGTEPDGRYIKLCCRISKEILLTFKEINLLIELQVVCLLLIRIFYISLHFLDAESCNKTNCICTEWKSLYFSVRYWPLMRRFAYSIYLTASNTKLMHQEKKSGSYIILISISLNGTFSGFWT